MSTPIRRAGHPATGAEQHGRGLALAAGGARGAYQAGALLALAEAGVRFEAVAGSSIGALNGAYYTQGDGSPAAMRQLCDLWRAIPAAGILRLDPVAAARAVAKLAALGSFHGAVSTLLTRHSISILDPAPVAALLDKWVDYRAVRDSPTALVISVLPAVNPLLDILTAPWRQAAYLTAAELDPPDLRHALLAACAIPLVFPAQEVRGQKSGDAALVDTLPAAELRRRGLDPIVSIFLSDGTIQNRMDFPGTALHPIRPDLGEGTGLRSVFDFSAETVERLIAQGHEDAARGLAEVRGLTEAAVLLRFQGDANVASADRLPKGLGGV